MTDQMAPSPRIRRPFSCARLAGPRMNDVAASSHLAQLYRQMFLIRRLEEESARAYAQGKIGGFLHLYIGQEAIAVGACAALRAEDYIFQTYRDHGMALARGMRGSMHFFDVDRNFLGGWAIVGGHIALAVGAAFKSKYVGEDRVTMCFF